MTLRSLSSSCAMAASTLFATSLELGAQHVPETQPRAGEQRFDHFQYHSVHNSFVRGTTLTQQVDAYGAFQIELDIWYDNGTYDVQHNSCDIVGEDTLDNYLDDLSGAQALQRGFVVIDLQLHVDVSGTGCELGFSDFPFNWRSELESKFKSHLGSTTFYTKHDWATIDGRKLPSIQEFLRRGKHAMAIINADPDAFFLAKDSVGVTDYVQINASSCYECGWQDEAYKLTRHYPTAQLCFNESDSDWLSHVEDGFTFVATNCDDDSWRILNAALHPPVPTYVSHEAVPLVPPLGTAFFPYGGSDGLKDALLRVQQHQAVKGESTVPLVLEAGTHATGGVLDDALPGVLPRVVLDAFDGPVVLTN